MVHSCGSTGNVRLTLLRSSTPHHTICVAGSGKSILWYVTFLTTIVAVTVLTLTISAAIIQHVMTLPDTGSAVLAYFYFDFRDEQKKTVRGAVDSLLIQLSALKPCRDIIYRLYSTHGKGSQQPNNEILIDSLKEMLTVTARQRQIFIVMDALDECPVGEIPSLREEVLKLVGDLVSLQLPNLHICVTSRPEDDIQTKLKPLAVYAISLHDEIGQKIAISNYISFVVSSDARMKRWRAHDKTLVIERLSERADGMWVCFLLPIDQTYSRIVQVPMGILSTRDTTSRLTNEYWSNSRDVTHDIG